jgi:hypothetical protein
MLPEIAMASYQGTSVHSINQMIVLRIRRKDNPYRGSTRMSVDQDALSPGTRRRAENDLELAGAESPIDFERLRHG